MVSPRVRRISAVAVALAAVFATPARAGAPNSWTAAAPMGTGRFFGMAAPLPGGKVLVTGGQQAVFSYLKDTEVYDPTTDTWTPGADMGTARSGAVAVALKSGKVLVVGGSSSGLSGSELNTGEVYDPVGNTWTPVANTTAVAHGALPIAALLSDGEVLIAGGTDTSENPVITADLYDPADNEFHAASAMGVARNAPAAALLPGGKVLVAGGVGSGNTPLKSGEVYSEATNKWTPVANNMSAARIFSEAAPLPGGKALIAGGEPTFGMAATPTTSADIYDAATNRFSAAAAMHVGRGAFALTPVSGGRVLAAGGIVSFNGLSAPTTAGTEIYDPASNRWTQTAMLPTRLAAQTATLLPGGELLAAGGASNAGLPARGLTLAESFTPPTTPTAPRALLTSAGNRSATVSFAPPTSDGGLPILRYTIRASTGQTATVSGGRTVGTVRGLRNGRAVTFTVTASNTLGSGPASGRSAPVIPGPPILRLSGIKSKMKLRSFLAGVTFGVTPNKPASLQISLLGSTGRATISRVFNLTLASKSFGLSGKRRTVKLVPAKRLVGRPRRAKVEVVIVAADAVGNRSTTIRSITISR